MDLPDSSHSPRTKGVLISNACAAEPQFLAWLDLEVSQLPGLPAKPASPYMLLLSQSACEIIVR